MKKILIIGAGPKALNILAKCEALKKQGWQIPEIIVIEKSEVGAHWTGAHGYTDGNGILGSPPFKTFNYPTSSLFGDAVAKEMDTYSFSNYLQQLNVFEKWIDGGMQWITHKEFANYLKWVGSHFKPQIRYGTFIKATPKNKKWVVTYTVNGKERTLKVDGIIPTGPGEVENPFGIAVDNVRVFDGKNWWHYSDNFKNHTGRIALIGGGISAGAIFDVLVPNLADGARVDWHTKRGLFARSENFTNNQKFSNPDLWQLIPKSARKQFMSATDRGSVDRATHLTMQKYHTRFEEVIGTIHSIQQTEKGVHISFSDGASHKKRTYDCVVMCTGFNPKGILTSIMKEAPRNATTLLEDLLEPDLSLEDFSPTLQLPMLSHIKIGIGCATLGSPSVMSDRILSAWVSKTVVPTSEEGVDLRVIVQKTETKGEALFAKKAFKKGELVVKGYPTRFSNARTKTSVQVGIDMHMEPSYWFLKANHSCEPNCGIKMNNSGGYSLVALKHIDAGEEITWDYAMTEYKSIALAKNTCQCGSKKCRKKIGGFSQLSDKKRTEYQGFTAPYLTYYV